MREPSSLQRPGVGGVRQAMVEACPYNGDGTLRAVFVGCRLLGQAIRAWLAEDKRLAGRRGRRAGTMRGTSRWWFGEIDLAGEVA